jgi:hypothetical protein
VKLYASIGNRVNSPEAATLSERLAAWHDAMVAHRRQLRAARTTALCHDDCPHSEARVLWEEAVALFGDQAHELSFLRSHAT